MMPVFPALAIGAVVLVADQVPTLDYMPSCRAAADGILGVKESVEACVRSETEARNQAAKLWSEFSAADKTSCTRLTTMGGGNRGTYSELLTCLEMKRDVRKLPKEREGTVGRVTR